MLAGTILILELRAATTERNTALNRNRMGVIVWLIVRATHNFDSTTFESRELKSLPRCALFNRGIGIKHFEHFERG